MPDTSEILSSMNKAVLEGDEQRAKQLAADALEQGLDPLHAIEEGFVPGVRKAGQLWEEGEYFLPELVTAAQAMTAAMEVLKPALEAGAVTVSSPGKVVIGTIKGDIHDIGKTLVATLMSANGFIVSDEGVDVSVEKFVERARETDADLVCASALLTTTMSTQRDLVTAVREAGLKAKVMVGGAPVNAKWAEQIGASGYADSAVAAVAAAKEILGAE